MTPIDPVTPTTADPRSSFAPPYVDDDPNSELVQLGLDEAEDETREAVADAYEASALLSDEPEESLDDIDFTESEQVTGLPEIAAIHEEWIPSENGV
jgi:hypothetical protein